MKTKRDESAFPCEWLIQGKNDLEFKTLTNSGLTKREYFAGLAMQGYISAGSTGMPSKDELANYAVEAADALIEALNSPTLGEK